MTCAKDGPYEVETKGRVWEGTTAKDDAIEDWCGRVSEATGVHWSYIRIDQPHFDSKRWALPQDFVGREAASGLFKV